MKYRPSNCLWMRGRLFWIPQRQGIHAACYLPEVASLSMIVVGQQPLPENGVMPTKSFEGSRPVRASAPVDEVDLEENPLNMAHSAGSTLSVLAGFQFAQIKAYQDEKGRGVHEALFLGFRLKPY